MTNLKQLQEELQVLLDQRIEYRTNQARLISAKKSSINREKEKIKCSWCLASSLQKEKDKTWYCTKCSNKMIK